MGLIKIFFSRFVLCLFCCLPKLVLAQCSISATSSGYNSAYNQVYVLVDQNGNIVDQNTTGTFSGLFNGVYQIHALNYDPANVPNPLPSQLIGQQIDLVGSNVSGCYNADFLTDFVTQACGSCVQSYSFCSDENVVVTSSGSANGYTQLYILVDPASQLILETNLSGDFTANVTSGNNYTIYALNYNPSDAPVPMPTVGQTIFQTGNIYTGCYNNDFLIDFVCINILDSPSSPLIDSTIQPDCNMPYGSIYLNGLPATGSWTIVNSLGESITGNGSSANFTNLTPGTNYSFVLINQDGCSSMPSSLSDSIFAAPNTPEPPSWNDTTFVFCPDENPTTDDLSLDNNLNWYFNSNPNNPISQTTLLQNGDILFAQATDGNCVSASSNLITIETYSNPNISITVDSLSICNELSLELENTTPFSTNSIWTINGQTFNGNSVNYYSNIENCINITLSLFDGTCNVSYTENDFICQSDLPISTFSMDNSTVSALNNEISLLNLSSNATNYEWFVNNQFLTNTENANTIIEENSEIMLIAYNEDDCSDTSVQFVVFTLEEGLYVPNSFTPDQDEHNQVFKPVYTSSMIVKNYSLWIYNRWGEIIFESKDPSIGWDGSYGYFGKHVQDDTYIWVIQFSDNQNNFKKLTGHVNLLR